MYVCMSGKSKRVCMYVCMSQAAKHVCMYVSSIHTYTLMSQTYIQTLSEFLVKSSLRSIQKALKHVCMFENLLPVMENETYIHA